MTTKLGRHCIIDNLIVTNLTIDNHITMHEDAEIRIPNIGPTGGEHSHNLSSNHSTVYFKYLFQNKIVKFTTTSGSQVVKITFAKEHHFDVGTDGIKLNFTGEPSTTNLRGLSLSDFEGKVDINQYQTTILSNGQVLNNKELAFETATAATSNGIIAATSMVGTIAIYKYLDLAGSGTSWDVAFDQAPGALHE